MVQGISPYVSSNGAKPVEVLTLEFKANSTIGRCRCVSQSNWSGRTAAHNTWDTLRIILSDAPLDCGWNAVERASLTPRRRCISVQKSEGNLGSLSLTIVSGGPCNRTM